MENAVIYARYSSDNQRDASIDAQVRACSDYAAAHDMQVIHVYADRAMTGTTDHRPEFQQMLSDARSGDDFTVVLVHKLDRFSRDRLESLLYKRDLEQHGVQLVSTLEHFGNDPESVILESVIYAMNEYYSKNLAREVRKGMRENALHGLHCGGMAPYGFRLDRSTGKLVEDPEEADAVRMIFDSYLSGASYSQIARKISEAGHKTKTGGCFSPGSIHDILINEKYCGIWTYGKRVSKDARSIRNHHQFNETYTRIEGGCPSIVSEAVFQAAQERLSVRKRGSRCTAKTVWKLSGIARCGLCGEQLSAQIRTARGGRYLYYRCKNKSCPATSIPKEVLENEVVEQLDSSLSPESVQALADRMYQSLNRSDAVSTAQRRLSELEKKQSNILQAIEDGAPYALMSSRLAQVMEDITAARQQLLQSRSASVSYAEIKEFLSRFGAISPMGEQDQAEILRRNVKHVMVSPVEGHRHLWDLEIVLFPKSPPQGSAPVGDSMDPLRACHVIPQTDQITVFAGGLFLRCRVTK